jgi:ABC-type uncharacterized transport system involved in gliding motility auxiliary subunit
MPTACNANARTSMLVTAKTRRSLRINSAIFVSLLIAIIGALAYLSTRYTLTADWTANGRHTLSEASRILLSKIDGPVDITAFAPEDQELRDTIEDLVERYQVHKPDLSLKFVNPEAAPDQLRQLNISSIGELILRYGGRTEHVSEHSEEALSNALQRLLRGQDQWLVFITGHGERDPLGNANHDLGAYGQQLQNRGFKTQALNLASTPAIPDNTAVLIIASPEVALTANELTLIEAYIDRGGSLLWLVEPGPMQGLERLADKLGLAFPPGTVVDPSTRQYGIEQPTFILISRYGAESAVAGFKYVTLFPNARAIRQQAGPGWQTTPLLTTGAQAWAESGPLEGTVKADEGQDTKGPLDIGLSMSRDLPASISKEPGSAQPDPAKQRIVVIGDGDFLSNKYVGNSGNLDLGLKLMNWLARDDQLVAIPARTSPDANLELSAKGGMLLWFSFQLLLPVLLAISGFYVWLQRRNA